MNEEVKGSVVADAKGWISKDCLAFLIECFAVGLLVQGVKVDSFTETSTKKKKKKKGWGKRCPDLPAPTSDQHPLMPLSKASFKTEMYELRQLQHSVVFSFFKVEVWGNGYYQAPKIPTSS